MNLPDDLRRDHQRRLVNQRVFPQYYVECACAGGCAVCAYTGTVSRAEVKLAAAADAAAPGEPRRR